MFPKPKVFFLLLWLLCVPLVVQGQSFEWVYSIFEAEDADPTKHHISSIYDIAVNSNKEVYAVGYTLGSNDFDDGPGQLIVDGNLHFILKLDENKNVLWVKTISERMASIELDANGNVIIGGYIETHTLNSTTTSLDPDYNPYDPDGPDNEYNLLENEIYGFVLKLDPNGDYIGSTLFEGMFIDDIAISPNNTIVAVGGVAYFDFSYYNRLSAYICKLDNDLNLVWDKTYDDHSGDYNTFLSVAVDGQNNIYCQGTYRNNFIFGSRALNYSPASEFVCKFSPNGGEEWIIELYGDYPFEVESSAVVLLRKIEVANYNIHFFTTYHQQYSYQFTNTTINNLPLVDEEEAVFFKVDAAGNHLWHMPLYGTNDQEIENFTINSLGEPLVFIGSDDYGLLEYGNSARVETNNASSLLLKVSPTGQLRNFTRLDLQNEGWASMVTDIDDNIYISEFFERPTDFDPHPFTEHFLLPEEDSYNPYLLKLSNCESEPYYEDTYVFCAETNPNPSLADIAPSPLNIEWFSSMGSQTPLDENEVLVDGQTYYYETLVESCPIIGRHPVEISIAPPPSPPVIEAEQPCYTTEMTLSDLNISGENIAFYASQQAENPLEPSTAVVPGTSYYVSQTTACESERIPVVVTDYFGEALSEYTAYFCMEEEEGTAEYINLSDYNHYFVPANAEEADYVFSYHSSFDNADENLSPIADFQNYPVNGQTIYVRVYSTEAGCYKIAQLSLQYSTPPVIEDIEFKDWTSNNNSITILPNDESYTYSLNGVTYQSSNHFGNLPAGEYTVYIKNGAGCDGRPETIFLLNYPKFFTPNNDGQNDYWNIDFSQLQEVFNVEIYDRYGKLISVFGKDHLGWDGTYNGKPMPSSEFWFRITRISDQKIIYKGHFSLIR